MLPVTKTTLPPLEEFQGYLERIWQNGWLTNNAELARELADELAAYLGVPNLELVASGTLALQIALKALGVRGEVITTPYSYVATPNAIRWEGCEPVFADIDPATFCIDPERVEAAVTERTGAILATHVYGFPCDVERLEAIARRHGLKLIYDGAHAFGVRLGGRALASYGDCTALSFHATKLFHTAEGGALVCNDPALARRAGLMKSFGHVGEDDYFEVGINAKMSELHAAMGLCMLPRVAGEIAARGRAALRYDELLDGCGLRRPAAPAALEHNHAYYPVLFASHQAMLRARQSLLDQGIGPRRYFHPSLNTLPFLASGARTACPVSEDVCSRVLCLPLFAGLEAADIERVCAIVRASA